MCFWIHQCVAQMADFPLSSAITWNLCGVSRRFQKRFRPPQHTRITDTHTQAHSDKHTHAHAHARPETTKRRVITGVGVALQGRGMDVYPRLHGTAFCRFSSVEAALAQSWQAFILSPAPNTQASSVSITFQVCTQTRDGRDGTPHKHGSSSVRE